MDTLFFRYLANTKHIYIPDGLELDEIAYSRISWFVNLESISISSKHKRPPKDVKYRCEIRGENEK